MNILAFIQPGTNSRSIMLDAARGFERAGHRLFLWELAPMWSAYQRLAANRPAMQSEFSALVRSLIEANRIDASIGMWANTLLSLQNTLEPDGSGGHRIVSFFDAIDHPHALLWLDAPHWAHANDFRQHFRTSLLRQRRVHHIINNPGTAREMTDVLGFTNVLARPYGVDETLFRPHGLEKSFDIVFGSGPGDPPPTALALEELNRDEPDMRRLRHEAGESIIPELSSLAKGDAAMDRLLRALLAMQIENRDEPMLDRIGRVPPEHREAATRLSADPKLFVSTTMAIRGVERYERAFTLAFLSRRFKCATFGSGDYSAWGCSAHRFGEVAFEDQAKIYSRGLIGLNVGRWQDDGGLNLKCFEMTASGAACLCAWRRGFDDCFVEEREAVSFRSPSNAVEALRRLLSDRSRLEQVARAGRERTLRDHTWAKWASDCLNAIVK